MDKGGALVARDGYKKDRPPEDDCCSICFDSFEFPSRASCGHWFCSSCILNLSRHTGDKPCKCPMCCCIITKLTPQSLQLIHKGAEAQKILKDVKRYNRLYDDSWLGSFRKALVQASLMRHRMRENILDPKAMIFKYRVLIVILWLSFLMSKFYDFFGFNLIPGGGSVIVTCALLWSLVMELLLFLDVGWYRWRRWRARRVAVHAGLHLD